MGGSRHPDTDRPLTRAAVARGAVEPDLRMRQRPHDCLDLSRSEAPVRVRHKGTKPVLLERDQSHVGA